MEEQIYRHYMVVRHEHLNQYGNLFGGHVLAVIDELAFIACSRSFPGMNFVTRAIKDAEFTTPARLGDIIQFQAWVESQGRTSVTIRVRMNVHCGHCEGPGVISFDGAVIMVCVDKGGRPTAVSRHVPGPGKQAEE